MHRVSAGKTRIVACAASIAAFAACDRVNPPKNSTGGGTLVIAATADPDALFPPLTSNVPGHQVSELLYDHLADLGPAMNVVGDDGFTPALADSWKWGPDSLSISFHLNPRARWHDGVPVKAEDVLYTHTLYTGPALGNPMGDDLKSVDSVTKQDSLTCVFWFHSRGPEQFYTATNMMLILPKHVYATTRQDSLRERASATQPIGSGRFRFVSWTQGVSLEIAADTANYRGRPSLDRVIWSMTPDYSGAITKLFGGSADIFDALHAETVGQIAHNPALRALVLPGMEYAFVQFNLRDPSNRARLHPLFANRELRRALTMLTDRQSMVRNVFDSLGAVSVGPAIRALPTTSAELVELPFDTARAGRILDSLGWRSRNNEGVRMKGGRAFTFSIIVPSSSSARNRMAVMLQSQLARGGVRMQIEKLEWQAFQARQTARTFDATFGNWHTGPSASAVREGWTSAASRRADGRNYGAYESAVFDAEVDSAAEALDSKEVLRHYTRAYQAIIEDAPAIWVYEPKTILGLHRRIRTTGMIPAAWWAGMANWKIEPGGLLPRDRLGHR